MQRPYLLILIAMGAASGLTHPLGKIAEAGRGAMGLVFWELAICALAMGALMLWQRKPLPLHRKALEFYLVLAVLGTLIPSFTFYTAVAHLPAGVMSLAGATTPLLAFPLALAMGMDHFGWKRLLGLGLGLAGVALVAAPGMALPEAGASLWLLVALIGPLFYAVEGVYIARTGMRDLDPVPAMFGTCLIGSLLALPMAWVTGEAFMLTLPVTGADAALIMLAMIHAVTYTVYIWLAAKAGAVFAAQVSYFITVTGVVWAMILLGERPGMAIWFAAALMLGGMFLVRPKDGAAQVH